MAASASDRFQKVGMSTATTLSAPGYTIGNTSITVASTTNWPTDTGVTFAVDEVETVDGQEVRVAGTYNIFRGTVASATSITNLTYVGGDANKNYSAGASTRVYILVSYAQVNRMIDGILVEHNQDGTHSAVTATSVTATGTVQGATVISTGDIQHRSVSLETIRSEITFDHVASGCVWSGDSYGSTRAASMTSGVVYIGGKRVAVSSVTARSFTASKDTYIDVDNTGTLTYTEVTNNAASPALAASSIRLGIIVTGASNIANAGSVNQGQENKVLPIASSVAYSVTDSLGNLICPRDPNRRILGYKQITANDTNTGAISVTTGLTCPVIVPTGRKVRVSAWGQTITGSTSPFDVSLAVYDGTVAAGTRLAVGTTTIPTNNYIGHVTASALTTPTSTSKTYEAGHTSSGGNGILQASATSPAYIMVELV